MTQDDRPNAPLPSTLPHLLTVDEVGDALRVSRSSILRLIKRGELATVRVGRRRLVLAGSVQALLEQPAS
jgi:excisionase family DNA binding protein